MSTAFGINSNSIEEPNNEYRIKGKKVVEANSFWIALFLFAPKIMDFFSIPIVNRHIASFYINMFRENVEYRQAHNIIRHDFMNLLIQLMERGYVDPDDGMKATTESSTVNKLTLTEATAQSFIFFIAGFETSSTTATFTLYELAQHHDIQDKVHQEIDEILIKHGGLTYDAMNEMTYLHKVVKETMRKYPPLPVLNRICTKEINLPTTNIRVPKGTLITIPVLGLHRDPSIIYPDPDKFDPERFNANEIARKHSYAYLPFGEGPRICIGFANYYQSYPSHLTLTLWTNGLTSLSERRSPVFSAQEPILHGGAQLSEKHSILHGSSGFEPGSSDYESGALPLDHTAALNSTSRFGYVQTKVGLVSLPSKYKFKLHPRTSVPLIFNEKSLNISPKGGVHFIIEPR